MLFAAVNFLLTGAFAAPLVNKVDTALYVGNIHVTLWPTTECTGEPRIWEIPDWRCSGMKGHAGFSSMSMTDEQWRAAVEEMMEDRRMVVIEKNDCDRGSDAKKSFQFAKLMNGTCSGGFGFVANSMLFTDEPYWLDGGEPPVAA